MALRVRKGETCFGGLVGSGKVRLSVISGLTDLPCNTVKDIHEDLERRLR